MPIEILCTWTDDEVFRPVKQHRLRAGQELVVGLEYIVKADEWEERSSKSHNHYFAQLQDYWSTLPERLAARFPTVEHLRKYLLIKTGYYHAMALPCADEKTAQRVSAMAQVMDEYCITTVEETLVTVYRAKSQKLSEMNRKQFQQSKTDVLEAAKDLLGL